MILQLDVGNSAIKWRLCRGDVIRQRGVAPRRGTLELPSLEAAPAAVWVASVAGEEFEGELSELLGRHWGVTPWFARSEAAACGVVNSYAAPERMGVDRWLAMIAAWQQYRAALCVVDAGSALTIDFLDDRGTHRGGYILPGADMMERALLEGTDRVRFGAGERDRLEPGNSTETAVLHGLQLAQTGAVELALSRFGRGEELVFSGGHGGTVMRLLERGGSFREDLVLDGLAFAGAAAFVEPATE